MKIFNLIQSSDIEGVKEWIDNEKTNKNVFTNHGDSPLLYALNEREEDIAKLFVKNDLYIFYADITGHTPLHRAAAYGYTEITLLLIGKGVNVNALNEDGNLPIHYAANHGKSEIIRILIENGSEINTIDKYGASPLSDSIIFFDTFKALKILLDEGAALFNNINYLSVVYVNSKNLLKHHFKLQSFILVSKKKETLNCSSLLRFSKTFKLSFKE